MKITYSDECLGYHHGQSDCEASIMVDGETVGYVDYVLYNNQLTISHIFVMPEHRRKGYGSRLMKYIKQQNPKYRYKPSNLTDDGAKFVHKKLSLDESKLNEETIVGSVWRSCSEEWLHQFINQGGMIDHGENFISFSFDSESGGQDKFGEGQVVVEFDEKKILNQGRKQDLGEIYYEEQWMEEHPAVCRSVTGFSTKELYYEQLGVETDEEAFNSSELTWETYIDSFHHEQEIVLKKLIDEEGLIKSIIFNIPGNIILINKLKRKGIPYTLNAGLNDSQQKIQFESYNNWINEGIKHLAPRDKQEIEENLKFASNQTVYDEWMGNGATGDFEYEKKCYSILKKRSRKNVDAKKWLGFIYGSNWFREHIKELEELDEGIKHLSGRSEEEANKVFRPEELKIFKKIEEYLKTLDIKVDYEFNDGAQTFLNFNYNKQYLVYIDGMHQISFIFQKDHSGNYESIAEFSFESFIEFKEKMHRWIEKFKYGLFK